MKLLITGATGLVGKALIKKSLSQGTEIHFLTTQKAKINSIEGAKGFYWNLLHKKIDVSCFEGVEIIIHLAGATISKRWTTEYKKVILTSRLESTKLLLNGIKAFPKKHNIKKLVSASAIGIYPSDFDQTVDEETPVSPNSFMEKIVIDWENESDSFNLIGIKVAKLRIGLVLSDKGGVVAVMKIPTMLYLGAAFGSGKQGQSWIHIYDLVSLILFVIKNQWEGVFNAVSPGSVSQNHFISALAKSLNRRHISPPLPKFLIQFLVGEMSCLILDSHWVSPQKVLDNGFVFKFEEINNALENIFNKKD